LLRGADSARLWHDSKCRFPDCQHAGWTGEAWVEEVGETHIRVRPTASPFGKMIGNDHEVRWLHRPEYFVVVKGHGFI